MLVNSTDGKTKLVHTMVCTGEGGGGWVGQETKYFLKQFVHDLWRQMASVGQYELISKMYDSQCVLYVHIDLDWEFSTDWC